MTKPTTLFVSMVMVASVLVLGSCGSSEDPTATPRPAATATPAAAAEPTAATPAEDEPKYGGILVAAQRADPPGWDPMRVGTVTLYHPGGNLYGRGNFVRNNRYDVFSIVPSLATSWDTSADFKTWTFTMRDDVFWHDGTAFTAEDAVWWLDLLVGRTEGRKAGRGASAIGTDSTFEVVDGNKVRFTKASPAPSFLNQLLSNPNYNIAHPKHLMQPEIDKGNVNVAPNDVDWIALGGFEMDSYVKGSVIRVRKFDRYWEKDQEGRQLPFLDGIDFAIITDEQSVMAAFRTGRVDTTTRGNSVSKESEAAISAEQGDQVFFSTIPAYGFTFAPNDKLEPWTDVRVRKALSLWIDRAEGIQTVLSGGGTPSALFSPFSPFTNPDFMSRLGYNPATREEARAEAKRLLAEAGYPNGFKASILCRDRWIPYCEFAVAQVAGLLGSDNASLDVVDTATRNQRIADGDFDLLLASSQAIFPDGIAPDFLTTNASADVQTNDTKIDDLFAKLSETADAEEKIQIAREVENYLIFEQYHLTMFWFENAVQGFRSFVKGFPVPQQDAHQNTDYVTVWLDK